MSAVTRRHFLLSTAALSVGCVARQSATAPQGASAIVRPPAVGQTWRYSKHDSISGALVDTETDRVASVGQTIELEAHSEMSKPPPTAYPAWGTKWLQKYSGHDGHAGPLPSEVQEPWGMVLVDPHWSQLQVYEQPIPLWPTELRPGWSARVNTKYKTQSGESPLPWQLTMDAHDWEAITVPAGNFKALRYTNLINFRSTDFARTDSQRRETVWFVPEVGRWVARESTGSYYHDDSVADQQFTGNSFRWELLSWS